MDTTILGDQQVTGTSQHNIKSIRIGGGPVKVDMTIQGSGIPMPRSVEFLHFDIHEP